LRDRAVGGVALGALHLLDLRGYLAIICKHAGIGNRQQARDHLDRSDEFTFVRSSDEQGQAITENLVVGLR